MPSIGAPRSSATSATEESSVWAHENILDTSRIASLAPQPQQPLVLTMTCLNGYFQSPYSDSLAEALLKAEGKGAIAVFSPSGYSVNDTAQVFHEALLAELDAGRPPATGRRRARRPGRLRRPRAPCRR